MIAISSLVVDADIQLGELVYSASSESGGTVRIYRDDAQFTPIPDDTPTPTPAADKTKAGGEQ